MSIRLADADKTTLRFPIGTRVECNCGSWKPGTIAKHFYAQKSFPEGMCVPYQVRLDDNKLIFAPADEDRVVRALVGEDPLVADPFEEEYLDDAKDADKLPVTVITGFLGAGKTTLINHILTGDHGKRICVIENEFGAVDIDSTLVRENMQVAEEVISLDNGCACCTVRGDLVKALTKLKDRKGDFDMLLIETTGLANPAPVVATFSQNATMSNNYRVDGIVCLVDCKFIKQHIDEVRADDAVNEAVCQVAFADRVLLNKVDLVSSEELAALKTTISEINAFAEQYETERSKVPLEKVMNLSAFSIERMNAALDEFDIDVTPPDDDQSHGHDDSPMEAEHGHSSEHAEAAHETEHGHSSEHGHAEASAHASEHGHVESEHGHADKKQQDGCDDCDDAEGDRPAHDHSHSATRKPRKKKHDLSGVGSLGLTADAPLISKEFNAFMSDLLRTRSKDLYRSKGVLCFAEEGLNKFVFQGVHENIQYTTAIEPWLEEEVKISKCVFIGRGLDHDALREGWARCISSNDPPASSARGFLGAAADTLTNMLG